MHSKKIVSINDLQLKIKQFRVNNYKIVHCHGVFDLLHIGHIKHFNFASKVDEKVKLIVTLTTDRFVKKGPGKPYFNEIYRAQALASLAAVDLVCLSDNESAVKLINIIKPDYFIKGSDYKNFKKDITKKINLESLAVKKNKGIIKFSDDITFSSSSLINNFSDLYNQQQKSFLIKLLKKYSANSIFSFIEDLKKIKVLILGETIIDEYIFCNLLGKSGKESHLVLNESYSEQYLGGVIPIAKILGSFCKTVDVVTFLGEDKKYRNFILKNSLNNINLHFFFKDKSPTIVKKRYIDLINGHKLIGIYKINDEFITKDLEQKILFKIYKLFKKNNLIVVSDYGHGLMTDKIISAINSSKQQTFINCQLNASNVGYHSLSKYKKGDFLILNENELRHEMRDKNTNLDLVAKDFLKKTKIIKLVITQGGSGVTCYERSKKTFCPAFAKYVIDKVGAGDSMLAMLSLTLKNKIPTDLALFISSIAAAFAVENIGNKNIFTKDMLIKNLQHILK